MLCFIDHFQRDDLDTAFRQQSRGLLVSRQLLVSYQECIAVEARWFRRNGPGDGDARLPHVITRFYRKPDGIPVDDLYLVPVPSRPEHLSR